VVIARTVHHHTHLAVGAIEELDGSWTRRQLRVGDRVLVVETDVGGDPAGAGDHTLDGATRLVAR